MHLTDKIPFIVIDFITVFPQPFLVAWVLCRFHTVNRPKTFIFVLAFATSLCHTALLNISSFPSKYILVALIPLHSLVCYLFIPHKIKNALTLSLLLLGLMVTIEILFAALLHPFYYNESILFPKQANLLSLTLIRSVYNLIYALCIFGLYTLFRRRIPHEHCAPTALSPFLFIYIWQTTLSILLYMFFPHHTPLLSALFFCSAVLAAVSMVAIVQLYSRGQAWYSLKRRQDRICAQRAVYETQRQKDAAVSLLKKQLYGSLQTQINTMLSQVDAAQPDALDQSLQKTCDLVGSFSQLQYCKHPVADAVLWEKSTQCTQNHITFTHTVSIPADLGLSPVVLCSLFSNLLDNSIAACRQLPEEQRWIACRAACRGIYLVVQTENPYRSDASADAPRRKGRGLRILSGLAKKYGGSLEISKTGGRFQITVCLRHDGFAVEEC